MTQGEMVTVETTTTTTTMMGIDLLYWYISC